MLFLLTDTGNRQTKSQETSTMTNIGTGTASSGSQVTQNHVGSQIGQDDQNSNMGGGGGGGGGISINISGGGQGGGGGGQETSKSEGTQAGGTLERSTKTTSTGTGTRTKDFGEDMVRDQHDMHHNMINNNQARRNKSKSTEDMNVGKDVGEKCLGFR